MKSLYLVGAGGHCVSCIDVIQAAGNLRILGIFDVPEKVGSKVLDIPVIGTDSDISKYVRSESSFLVTVGQIKSPDIRIRIFQNLLNAGASLATVISPRAYVSPYAKVSEGAIVMHDALINANAVVGKNCIINTKSLVEHDAVIMDHCHVSTSAVVNGGCVVKEGSFIGSNSVLKEGLIVPARSVLGAGFFHR